MIKEIKALLDSTSLDDIKLGIILGIDAGIEELFTPIQGNPAESRYLISINTELSLIVKGRVILILDSSIYLIRKSYNHDPDCKYYWQNPIYDDGTL